MPGKVRSTVAKVGSNPRSLPSSEERIAKIEAQLAQLNKKLAELERSFKGHAHEVPGVEVGLLSEPINGRRIKLAINPRGIVRRTGPPAAG